MNNKELLALFWTLIEARYRDSEFPGPIDIPDDDLIALFEIGGLILARPEPDDVADDLRAKLEIAQAEKMTTKQDLIQVLQEKRVLSERLLKLEQKKGK